MSEKTFLARPNSTIYLITIPVMAMVSLGLLMVLSASSVKSYEQSGNTYSIVVKQLLFLAIALGAGALAFRFSVVAWSKIARVALILSLGILLLPIFPGLGRTINGNTSWIGVGPFTVQPSEFAKFGLILFCALQLRRYEERGVKTHTFKPVLMVTPGVLLVLALIMVGKDLGTALIVMGIAGSMIFVSGLQISQFLLLMVAGLGMASAFVVAQPNRLHRFTAILHPFSAQNYKFAGWQTAHSIMGLASGGWFGVGLGASRQKWANLSEANTDFIFSVIGEEMGLLGTLFVLSLYAVLIFGIFRVALQTKDLFSRYAAAGVACWLMIQVAVNLGSDVGLFPVIGVTLPFISYGGSSLISNIFAIAFVLNIACRDHGIKLFNRKAAVRLTSVPGGE